MSTLTVIPVPAYHVMLAALDGREPIDLTPGRELSYPDARAILLDFARLYPVLHTAKHPNYLEIIRVGGAL